MPGTPYEAIMSKNSKLAEYTDRNHNIAGLMYKLINYTRNLSAEKGFDPNRLRFRPFGSPDGRKVIVEIEW